MRAAACRHQSMGAVRALAAPPDQPALFVSGGADKKLFLWDARQQGGGGPVHVVQGAHGADVTCAAFSSGGALLATGGADQVPGWAAAAACAA